MQNPSRNLRELSVRLEFPFQMVVEKLQEVMQQYTWTLGTNDIFLLIQ